MRTILIAAFKGGVGKSTVAILLASQAAKTGQAAIVDTDFGQGSVGLWGSLRDQHDNPAIIAAKNPERRGDLDLLLELAEEGGAEWLFIDSGPRGIKSARALVSIADFVIVPVQASLLDLDAVHETAELCREEDAPFAFLLNRVNPAAKRDNSSAVAALKEWGPVLTTRLQEHLAYKIGPKGAIGPSRPRIGAEVKAEVAALWSEVQKLAEADHGE